MADGVWRTIMGRRVFIKEGQTAKEAYKSSLKESTYKIDIQMFAEKGLEKQTNKQLEKGINSIKKEIEKHKEKIDKIDKEDNNYNKGLKKFYEKEIKHQEQQIKDREEELNRRKEK